MAKKIKFTLEMKDGVQVRTLEDLQENFDIEKVVGYFSDGKLQTWLEERYYEDEAEAISKLSKDDENFQNKLREALGVAAAEDEIDIEEIERRKERLEQLRQYTDDDEILNKIDYTAFDQEELGELLDEDISEIILCNNTFRIPLKQKNKKYVGVGKVKVIIKSKEKVDWDGLGIRFINVKFDEEYERIEHQLNAEEYYKKSVECEDEDEKIMNLKRAIEKGSTDAMIDLAWLYASNQSEEEEVIPLLEKAADKGNRKANNALGWLYYRGNIVPCDYSKALENFKEATKDNISDAYLGMGYIYEEGIDGENEIDKALDCYNDADRLGHARAPYAIGEVYENSGYFEKALSYYKRAFDNGIIDAANKIGDYYLYADGVEHDGLEALKWYKKGAEEDNVDSIFNVGLTYLYNNHMQDYEKALTWMKRAANKGVYQANTCIGTIYENGLGVTKSIEEAYKYYHMAADDGDAEAMRCIGLLYDEGDRNYWEAIKWYKVAAENDDITSYRLIGRLYYNGNGVEKDLRKACAWWIRASDAGDDTAKEWIKECFEEG